MGFLGNLLGITPNSGLNFQASGTNIQQPVTAQQVNAANAIAQQALQGQNAGLGLGANQLSNTQGFLQALQAQNALGNQSNVFGQQQGLANALSGNLGNNPYAGLQASQQGTANQLAGLASTSPLAGIQNQQAALAQQYANIAAGQGPNPAQAQLAQATGANNAQTAALLAGQRNANQNAGLMGRQIAQQQGANQQNLAGQAATLQAQQSLAALGQQGAQQQAQAQTANQAYQNQLGALGALGNQQQAQAGTIGAGQNVNLAYLQALQNQQNALANNAQNQTGNLQAGLGLNQNATNSQQGALGNLTGASQNQQNLLQQGLGQQNQANVAMQSNINNANSGIQQQAAKGQSGLLGGLLGSAGTALSTLVAHGGMIEEGGQLIQPEHDYAHGGSVKPYNEKRASHKIEVNMKEMKEHPDKFPGGRAQAIAIGISESHHPSKYAQGGNVPIETGPKSFVGHYFKNMKSGGPVAGHAKVPGDSYENDTVKAMLSPGEIVIPRHILNGKDPVKQASIFVAQILAKKGKK